MFNKQKVVIFVFFLSCFLFENGVQGAYFIDEPSSLLFKTSPEFPGPEEVVTISAFGSNFDESRTLFTWFIDNKEVAKGMGVYSITTKTGSKKDKQITARATLPNDKVITATKLLSGNYVDLLWESEGYRIPFINIRTPLLPQALSRVVAIQHVKDSNGTLLTTGEIYYTWAFNGQKMLEKSGFGKNTFYNDLSQRTNTISVSLSTAEGKVLAESQTTLVRVNPEVLIYQKHPLYGELYETAFFGNIKISESNIILTAEPFGFSIFSKDDIDVSKKWSINNTIIKNETGSDIALESPEGTQGLVQLRVAHGVAKFQNTLTNMIIQF